MTDEHIIAYLLQELPEDESRRFEDECFARDDWPAQISLVEEDLIDGYLRGDLTPEQRLRFEQNYLTTSARMEHARTAAALLRHVDEHSDNGFTVPAPPTRQTWSERLRAFWNGRTWAPQAALVCTVLVVAASVWWVFRPQLRPQLRIATLTLTDSRNNRAEGAQARSVKLPPDVGALRVTLMLPVQPAQGGRYRVELENIDGGTKKLEVVGQDAQSITVEIAAAQLTRGQYALKLFIVKADSTEQPITDSYFFTVE